MKTKNEFCGVYKSPYIVRTDIEVESGFAESAGVSAEGAGDKDLGDLFFLEG